MFYYSFDKKIQSRDPIELRQVCYWKLLQLFLTDLFQLLNIFFVQYKLFHLDIENEIAYNATFVISFLSGVITLILSIRIHNINRKNPATVMSIVILSLLALKYIIDPWFGPPRILCCGPYGKIVTELVTSVFVLFQVPNYFRQIVVTIYAVRCKFSKTEEDRITFYHEIVDAEADAGLLGILDCYLRGAPQLIVQIAAIFVKYDDFTQISWLEQVSIAAALGVVLPWTATSYHNSLRTQKNDHFPFSTVVVFFIWNAFLLAARILAISVVLAFWPVHTGVTVLVHWLVATLLLYYNFPPVDFYKKDKIWHFMFCSIFGIVYIFNAINMTKEKKFWHYICFYGIVFLENTVSLILWCTNEYTVIYRISFVIVSEILFIGGILIMILYYVKFHPHNEKDRSCENDQSGENIPLKIFNINHCENNESVDIPSV
ncbi:XK-related protein 4-like isoform X2 [Zophobas morio]|uniref:XK-related protein 4-like isoform X2 n=1 Tax=Zophobas morio TaxID=2755281 RepID=UPI003082F391